MSLIELKVPDIGDFSDVQIIELLVKPGDAIKPEQSLVTVESDKASMEIPASQGGIVRQLLVKVGDKVSEGSALLMLEPAAQAAAPSVAAVAAAPPTAALTAPGGDARADSSPAVSSPAVSSLAATAPTRMASPVLAASQGQPHASPSVRQFARELGVPLGEVNGSGPKGRITREDIQSFVRGVVAGRRASAAPAPGADEPKSGGLNLLPWPQVDFAKFGEIERQPLSRIKKISGANLARNWVMIPHVTNCDEADVTDLEALRVQLNLEQQPSGTKVTMLAFLIKACVAALKRFPVFNASLDGDDLVLKRYFHIGFAADTPNGLMVPVVRDADRKGVLELAQETAHLARLARDGKLAPGQMQGGCFSISSLGGIGGTTFTPIINAPEVAILGVCRAAMKAVWNGQAFEPRLTLPLSLSYDHRVIDGAAAARFNAYLVQLLADFRRIAL